MTDRPPISCNLEIYGYGLVTFPIAVEYDSPTDTWAAFCPTFDTAGCAASLEDAVKSVKTSVSMLVAVWRHRGQLDQVMREAGYEPEN